MKKRYNLAYFSWDKNEFSALNNSISKLSFSMGPKVKEFEKKFASKFKSKYAVMSNSGTSAIFLSFLSLFYTKKNFLKIGDEIIVPGLSWSTSYSPIHILGLKLKFVDISYKTLNIDEKLIEKSITKKTKAILAVNLLGLSCNFDYLKKISIKYNLHLIEDNCESLGAKFKNRYTGTIGSLGAFSFFFSHHLQTMEGGMTLTNNKELYEIMKSCRAHGWTRDLSDSKIFSRPSNKDYRSKFHFILPGMNLRPLELSAVVGIEQLKKMNKFINIRKKNAKYFYSVFNDNDDFDLQDYSKDSSFFSFALIKKKNSKINIRKFTKYLQKNNIEIRPIAAGAILNQPVGNFYSKNSNTKKNLLNSNYISENGFYVGNGSENLKSNIDYLYYLYKNF